MVVPIVDIIDKHDFSLVAMSSTFRGGFDWSLRFLMEYFTAEDRQKRLRDPTVPIKSPAQIGCSFAINREWFIKLGIFDDEMEIWGAEHVESSLRVWMCGGEVEIVPCSRVGHVFNAIKNVQDYPEGMEKRKTIMCNNKRLARAWLDQFEVLFNITLRSSDLAVDCGTPTKILNIRKELNCKNFEWYIKNVYTSLMVKYLVRQCLIDIYNNVILSK